jgi:hypothetical protein
VSSLGAATPNAARGGPLGKLAQWINAMPHPTCVCEVAPTYVAAARWSGAQGSLGGYGVEVLPPGTIQASPVEPNVLNAENYRSAVTRLLHQIPNRPPSIALLLPDEVVRVFILSFDTFPRKADEAAPLLRLRLKKSVPFDVEDTTLSWMKQVGRTGNVEVIAALARKEIVREYEQAFAAEGAAPGVVLSSSLASLPLLESQGATLMVRMSGRSLATVIVRSDALCVFRTTDMSAVADALDPQSVLEEIFPSVAYFQDTWGASIDRVRIAGFADRTDVFRNAIAHEMKCPVEPLGEGALHALPGDARTLMNQGLEPLVGWMMNGAS